MISHASRRALGTPELLEAILYHLPLQDLLRAQSVCKAWQTVIDRSKKLQRALYLEPVFWDPVTFCEGQNRLEVVEVTATGYEQGVTDAASPVLYGQVPVNDIAQCTLGHIADGLEQQLQAFGGHYLLSCEVPGWLEWQIVEVNEQSNVS
ncbi:hypothetical protein KC353_g11006 [Hortaea werneckii]|nr:hypothetical protein KC353_g11006 [Hortaea werneckii]